VRRGTSWRRRRWLSGPLRMVWILMLRRGNSWFSIFRPSRPARSPFLFWLLLVLGRMVLRGLRISRPVMDLVLRFRGNTRTIRTSILSVKEARFHAYLHLPGSTAPRPFLHRRRPLPPPLPPRDGGQRTAVSVARNVRSLSSEGGLNCL